MAVVQVFLRNLPYKLVAADIGERMTELCGEVRNVRLRVAVERYCLSPVAIHRRQYV